MLLTQQASENLAARQDVTARREGGEVGGIGLQIRPKYILSIIIFVIRHLL